MAVISNLSTSTYLVVEAGVKKIYINSMYFSYKILQDS
jgi:hypothetical protein